MDHITEENVKSMQAHKLDQNKLVSFFKKRKKKIAKTEKHDENHRRGCMLAKLASTAIAYTVCSESSILSECLF